MELHDERAIVHLASPTKSVNSTRYGDIIARCPPYSQSINELPPPSYEDVCSRSYLEINGHRQSSQENIYENVDQYNISSCNSSNNENPHSNTYSDDYQEIDCKAQSSPTGGQIVDYAIMPVLTCRDGMRHLLGHAKGLSDLSLKMANHCSVYSCISKPVFRYTLQSLIEQRSFVTKTRPYVEACNHHDSCYLACKWDYDVPVPASIQRNNQSFKVPSSEQVISCKSCIGYGTVPCQFCKGHGTKTCSLCHGFDNMQVSVHVCLQCNGGLESCRICSGIGRLKCKACTGKGKLLVYQTLRVNWNEKERRYVDGVEGIPSCHLKRAFGRRVYEERHDGILRAIPKDRLLQSEIVHASAEFIAETRKMRCGVIRKQMQAVDIVLVQRFDCKYKKKRFSFYLLGDNREFYSADFPSRSIFEKIECKLFS